MAPQTPLLFVDNIFDRIVQYPNAVVTADVEAAGREAKRVYDYRRDRTSWTVPAAASGHNVSVDLGVGQTATPDYLFLDRGHNLWGHDVAVRHSPDGINFTTLAHYDVPALGTVGGDPTSANYVVTEEGALYIFLAGAPAKRAWQVDAADNMAPIVTGIMMGKRTQLLGYSNTFDEDAGGRTYNAQPSTTGWLAAERTYAWRTLELGLELIGATEYDSTIRTLRSLLFAKNEPFVCVMDYATRPERAWMYRYDGSSWGMPKNRTYRKGVIRCREHLPAF